jgi:hypothetical protein
MEIQGDLKWEIQGDFWERCRKIDGMYSEIRRDTRRSAMGVQWRYNKSRGDIGNVEKTHGDSKKIREDPEEI